MKPRHIAMGAALVLAAGLLVFGDNTPEDAVAEPVERAQAAPRARAVAAKEAPAILRLIPRETLIGGDDRFGQDDEGRDVFARQDWTPPPPPPPPAGALPPPPPPSAPPLPFTYIGKSLQEGRWEIFLARGDRTYLVREAAVIDGAYRVDAIRPPVLTLTYLPLNQVQQLNIGVFD
ncbi:hypothetical protein LQ564_21655 [Massilia sp. G4R7]|uniref:Prolin-rich transmembrane protein n=1 Tax=Massilia phyllostachyos TaxID=2898585 RepID=A0ABS8QB04_9BURK|nr:hypothetical protein [Massilia phyllostachyos]MCD2518909.1 hypothetical protein [Massilia phyllostachyos]